MMKSFFLCVFIAVILGFVIAPQLSVAGTLPSNLSWSNTNTTDQIQISKSPSINGTYTNIALVLAGQTTYTDATNNPGETSCYKAAYSNSSGIGPPAGPVCKTFPPVPVQTPATFQVE